MLANLIKILKYKTGAHTIHLETIMAQFKPTSEQEIIQTLLRINKKKQYIDWNPISQSFINKIQYFLLKKQAVLNSNTLFIYQQIKQLNFLTPRFKYGLLRRLSKQMQRIIDQNLNIKNNELQVLLWFIYREYPFERQTKFQQIANDHTLKLFEMHEYFNNMKKLPHWQPFIRVTTMLQALGHEPQTRKDLTRQILQSIDYTYYPYLTKIYKTPQDCAQFRKKQDIHEPLLVYLCNRYIYKDKLKYDKYLRYIQVIDNEVQGQEVDKLVDPLTWEQLTELFELYVKSYQFTELDNNLAYKINQLFWRICESKNVQIETGIRLLEILAQNPGSLGDYQQAIILRIMDIIPDLKPLQYKFLSGRAYLTLLLTIKKLQAFPQNDKIKMYQQMNANLNEIIFWEEEDKKIVLDFFEETKIKTLPNQN